MKSTMAGCHWLLMTCLLLLLQVSYEASQTSGGRPTKRAIFGWGRGPGLFGMISQFIRETIRDTNRAVRNITDIINAEFPPNSQSQNSTGNSTSVSGATRLTLPQVNDILGRNYRSLVRLFNTEFRSALVDSNRNIQRYRQEIKDAVRPYFVDGAFSTTTTPRSTTNPS
ncbi:uncharacterized protein isoform X3 [Rhodnius prolixus]|uniref:uncharacterized protein isoform X3 n=1 Tax=Rhodnius prolixus TaxID=13249 RepID=UPI003D18F82A